MGLSEDARWSCGPGHPPRGGMGLCHYSNLFWGAFQTKGLPTRYTVGGLKMRRRNL